MDEKTIQRIKKLQALAERGVGGEKTTAQKKLAKLLTKNIKKKAGQGNELQILQPFTPVITGNISKAAGKRDFAYRKF